MRLVSATRVMPRAELSQRLPRSSSRMESMSRGRSLRCSEVNLAADQTLRPSPFVPIQSAPCESSAREVIVLPESPSLVVNVVILPSRKRESPLSVPIHRSLGEFGECEMSRVPIRSLLRPLALVNVANRLFCQCARPRRVPIHSEPSSSTRRERMRSSGRPSAEVNVSTLVPSRWFRPSGVPTHTLSLAPGVKARMISLRRPLRVEKC